MTAQANDIGRRIFGEHLRLIGLILVAGAVVGLLLHATGGTTYTGSARLALDTVDPKSPTEAQAIADMANALATSPAQVQAAIKRVGVKRSALEVARNDVSVISVGTSGVLQLSLTDRDRRVAAALTNALAQRVIAARVAFSSGRLQQVLSGLQRKIDDLNAKIAALDVKADSLAARIANATSAASSSALRSERDALLQSRDLLLQERSQAESERVGLLSAGATRPDAKIISRATTTQTGPHWLSGALLGSFLGLILGIGLAAAFETARPTVAGSENLAKALDAPLIGVIRSAYPGDAGDELSLLKARLHLARDAAGAQTIGLVAADRSVDLRELVERLAATSPRAAEDGDVYLADLSAPDLKRRRGGGVVLVSPLAVKRSELVDLEGQLRSASPALLGVITYKTPPMRRWPRSTVRDRVPVVESA